MFTTGLDIDSRSYFSSVTAIISVPTAVKIFSYLSTYLSNRRTMYGVIHYAFISFLIAFNFGGFSGLILSSSAIDMILHDSYFVIAHFHFVLSLGALFGIIVGHYFILPIVTAFTNNESYDLVKLSTLVFGSTIIFFPMHVAGFIGMARRIPTTAAVFSFLSFYGSIAICLLMISIFLLISGMLKQVIASFNVSYFSVSILIVGIAPYTCCMD
jgi:cytochrome c oxidase subunit 1